MTREEVKKGEVIIYKTSKGPRLEVRLEAETVWLNLNQIAAVFDTDKSGISRHIKNIFKLGELSQKSTVAKIATVQIEGGRRIKREIKYYNLGLILSANLLI